jgi:uncharacterized cupredoxin-like copper-binding protein
MSPARRGVGITATLAAVLVAAGCGGGDDGGGKPSQSAGGGGSPSSIGAGSKLALSADPTGKLAFDKDALEGKAGRIRIVMKNPAPLSHNVSLEGPGIDKEGETVGQGGTSTVSASLKPGTYTFYCSVPGHREGGMEGKLTVE